MPELEPYRTLRRRKNMERLNLFVAEGEKIVRRLLDSAFDYELISMLVSPEWLLELREELDLRPEEIVAYVADKKTMEAISGYTVFQPVKVTARIRQLPSIEEIFQQSRSPQLFVACDELANAENMGAVIRNTAAFGGHAIFTGPTSTSPYLTRTIRASMGTIFELPSVEVENLADTLRDMKANGVHVIGAHAHEDGKSIESADFNRDLCFVFGSEGHGISDEIQALCDELVLIPMAGQVDSLNVGSSVAVFLYEAARQQGRLGGDR